MQLLPLSLNLSVSVSCSVTLYLSCLHPSPRPGVGARVAHHCQLADSSHVHAGAIERAAGRQQCCRQRRWQHEHAHRHLQRQSVLRNHPCPGVGRHCHAEAAAATGLRPGHHHQHHCDVPHAAPAATAPTAAAATAISKALHDLRIRLCENEAEN